MDVPPPQARITQHRRFPASVFQKTREVGADRVRLGADEVVDGRYTVRTSDASSDLPLRSRQDLQELQFFTAGGPTDGLARPGLALSIAQLADLGWKFFASTAAGVAEVGRYGAYNALTDGGFHLQGVHARLGANTAPLQADTPERMAAFYATPEGQRLHELEGAGYSFFDGSGRAAGAFQGREVGRREPWLPVDPAAVSTLGDRLQGFERFREAAPDVGTARKAWDFAQAYTPGAVPATALLGTLSADPRFGPVGRLCRAVGRTGYGSEDALQVLAPHIASTDVKAAALAVLAPGRYVSTSVRSAVAVAALQELQQDPAYAPATRLLAAMGELRDDLRTGVSDLLLRRPEVADSAPEMLQLAAEIGRLPHYGRSTAALEAPFARAVELSPGDVKMAEASELLAGLRDQGLRDGFLVELTSNWEAGIGAAVATCLRDADRQQRAAALDLGLAWARKGTPELRRLVEALVDSSQAGLVTLTALLEAGPKVGAPGFLRELARDVLKGLPDEEAAVAGPRLFGLLAAEEPAASRWVEAAQVLAKPQSQGRLFRHAAEHPEETPENHAMAARVATGADRTYSSDRDFEAGARLVEHFATDRARLALAGGLSTLSRYALGYYLLAVKPGTPLGEMAAELLQELPDEDAASLGHRLLDAVAREEGNAALATGTKHLLAEKLRPETQDCLQRALLRHRGALDVKALASDVLPELYQAAERTAAARGFLSWLREDPALARDADILLQAGGANTEILESFLRDGSLGEQLAATLERLGRRTWNRREAGQAARACLDAAAGDSRFAESTRWAAALAPAGSSEEATFVVGWAALRYAQGLATRQGRVDAAASIVASLSPSTAGDLPLRVMDHLAGLEPDLAAGLDLAKRLSPAMPENERLGFAIEVTNAVRQEEWKDGVASAARSVGALLAERTTDLPAAAKAVLGWLAETPPYRERPERLAGLALQPPEEIVKTLEDVEGLLAGRPEISRTAETVQVGDVSLPIAGG